MLHSGLLDKYTQYDSFDSSALTARERKAALILIPWHSWHSDHDRISNIKRFFFVEVTACLVFHPPGRRHCEYLLLYSLPTTRLRSPQPDPCRFTLLCSSVD